MEVITKEYRVLNKPEIEQLECLVNKMLKHGWELCGGFTSTKDGFCQAMTKEWQIGVSSVDDFPICWCGGETTHSGRISHNDVYKCVECGELQYV